MITWVHAVGSFGALTLLFVASIYFASAVFSGLSGFGFSAVGALTLCVLPPQFGVCMLMLLSVFTQTLSLSSLRNEVRAYNAKWQKGFLPYVAGGLLGMPLGLRILSRAPAHALILGLGALLVAYAAYNIFRPKSLVLSTKETSLGLALAVGAIGGVVGGFSAFPGSALVVWNGLRNLSKEQGRALTQPFILIMQLIGLSLAALATPKLFDVRMWALLVTALPLAWAGNRLGIEIYKCSTEINYRLVTLIALGISGFSLVLKAALFS